MPYNEPTIARLTRVVPRSFLRRRFLKLIISSLSSFQVVAQRQLNGVEQCLIVDGFAEISYGHPFQRSLARIIRVVAGYDDDWHSHPGLGHPDLHFKTVHYGHMHVQHDAVGPMGRHRFEQLGTLSLIHISEPTRLLS